MNYGAFCMTQKILVLSLALFAMSSCANNDVDKAFDCSKSDLTLSLESLSSASSCEISDGQINVFAQGGKEPYVFRLNDGSGQPGTSFPNLSSGIYTVTVRDKNGCEALLPNLVVLAEGFEFSATVLEDTQCVNGNGTVTVDVQKGNGPFLYKLENGSLSSNNVFTGLNTGSYTISIQDAGLCSVELNVVVPKGITGVSWSNNVLPIMKTSCAVNGCHDGKTRTDYRVFDNAKREAIQIKLLTKNKSMPFDGTPLTKDQIDLIGCWVDDGALNN
jgi:hypothetical protein